MRKIIVCCCLIAALPAGVPCAQPATDTGATSATQTGATAAAELLQRVAGFYAGLRSYSCVVDLEFELQTSLLEHQVRQKHSIRLQRPGRYAKILLAGEGISYATDGTQLRLYTSGQPEYYLECAAPAELHALFQHPHVALEKLDQLDFPHYLAQPDPAAALRRKFPKIELDAPTILDGAPQQVLRLSNAEQDLLLWISADGDPLINRLAADYSRLIRNQAGGAAAGDTMRLNITATFSDWRVNPEFGPADFILPPPPGAQPTASIEEYRQKAAKNLKPFAP